MCKIRPSTSTWCTSGHSDDGGMIELNTNKINVFMHDNARPHTAGITRQFLEQNRITVLPHPPMSPDLNPIEHIWDLMGRRIRDLERPPTNLHDLSELLVRIWNEIPQREIQACINMEERLQQIIRQRGGNTHY